MRKIIIIIKIRIKRIIIKMMIIKIIMMIIKIIDDNNINKMTLIIFCDYSTCLWQFL